jgi:hypothetical protein
MRRTATILAAATMVLGIGSPAWGSRSGDDGGYRHHEHYRGESYDYDEHRGSDPYSEDGPYDGYYECRRQEGPNHPETWCDHYYGRDPG